MIPKENRIQTDTIFTNGGVTPNKATPNPFLGKKTSLIYAKIRVAGFKVRGSLISMYQLMITIGIVLAFLSNTWLATYLTFGGKTGGHWRLMLGVIAIPAAIMFVGVLFLPESPRWLFLKGLKDRAVAVFERMHLDEAEIAAEVKEIEDNLKIKQNGFEMFKTNPNFRRVIGLGVGLQLIQQLTGINVVMY